MRVFLCMRRPCFPSLSLIVHAAVLGSVFVFIQQLFLPFGLFFFYFLYLQEERYCFLWTNTSIIYNEKHFNCSIFCHDLLIRGGAFFGIWLHLYFTYIIYSGTNEWRRTFMCARTHTQVSQAAFYYQNTLNCSIGLSIQMCISVNKTGF